MDYKESILCTLLDCGQCDLAMLENIEYDLWDILRDMMSNRDMNINSIFRGVFEQARFDLNSALEEDKEDIRERIKKNIETLKQELEELDPAELEALNESELHLALLDSGAINPYEDLTYYLNYLDTHVALKHYDFYYLWMEDHLLRIENLMGFDFEEGEW